MSAEKYAAISSIREQFIQLLIKKFKIQIQEVQFHSSFNYKKDLFIFIFGNQRIVKTEDKEIGFYLLHLPWAILVEQAERLKLKISLKVSFHIA